MLEKNIDLNEKTILVTGVAGFIGAYLSKKILEKYEIYRDYFCGL